VGGGSGAATWNDTGNLSVGAFGTGTLTITGGGTVSSSRGHIGFNSGATGTVIVGGGAGAAAWTITGALDVGTSGTGTLNINSGGTVSAAALDGGDSASAVNLNGGTLRITGTDSASNTFNLLSCGGTINVANTGTTFTITSGVNAAGTLLKTGNGALVLTNAGNIFNGGIQVNGGSLNVSDEATVGVAPLRTGAGGTIRYTANLSTARTFEMAGTLEAPTGVTLTLNGATVNGGFVRSVGTGSIAVGANGASLNGVTVFSGTTINQNGGSLTADNLTFGGTHTASSGQTFTGSNVNYTAAVQVNVNGTANVSNLTSVGRITVNSGGTLLQQNATPSTPLTLGGGSVTTVNSGGTLNWGGSWTTELGRLAGGVLINNGTVTGGRLVVDYGGLARGAGSYSVNPLTINGGQFSPGSSPGTGNVEAFIADGGNSYTFEINDGNGTAGATVNGRGWDLLTIRNFSNPVNSSFTTTATPANPFVIRLVTQNPNAGNANGLMANFDPNVSSQWLLFSVDPAAADPFPNGFDPTAFRIDASAFANGTNGGKFSLQPSGHQVNLTFTPVPEPAHVLLSAAMAVGLVGAVRRWRNRHSPSAGGGGGGGELITNTARRPPVTQAARGHGRLAVPSK